MKPGACRGARPSPSGRRSARRRSRRSRRRGHRSQDSGARNSRRMTSLASSRPRTVSTARSPSGVDEAVELLGSLEARPGHAAPGCAATARAPRTRAGSASSASRPASGARPASTARDVALRGAHVPPPRAGAVRVRGRADARRSRPGPSRAGCAGTRGPAGTSWRSPPTVARGGEDRLGALVAAGGRRRRGGASGSSARGVPGSSVRRVGAHVRRRALEGARRRACAPSRRRSRRRAEDEVEVPGVEAGVGHRGGDVSAASGPWRRPRPASTWALVDWMPKETRVTPAAPVGVEARVVGVLGVALDGHLGVGRPRDGGEDAAQGLGVRGGRRAAAEEDATSAGRDRRVADGALRVEDAGVGVALHQVVAVGVGGEGAVVAALPAERDVDVDAERAVKGSTAVERTERMRRSRCASIASVASSATSSVPGAAGRRARRRARRRGCGAAARARPGSGGGRCGACGTGCRPRRGRRRRARCRPRPGRRRRTRRGSGRRLRGRAP